MASRDFSEVALRFVEMLYDTGWIVQGFDCGSWYEGPEQQKLYSHRDVIAEADREQLAKLLTTLVRGDRFSEGTLAKAYDDKILLA